MSNLSSGLFEYAPTVVVAVTLSTLRLLTFIAIAPLFPSAVFPRLVRTAMAVGLGVPIAVGLFHQLGPQPIPENIVAIVLKEVVLGLFLALPVAMPFWALTAVGVYTDNQRGANAAQQVTPFAQADSSVLAGGLTKALLVALFASGAFAFIYTFLLQSFEVWPVLEMGPNVAQFGWDHIVGRFDEHMMRGLLYASPLLAIIILVDFAFALMSVFAPQLQTYFASMPIKSLAAIAVMVLYVHMLVAHSEDYFREVMYREFLFMESLSK
jgi:type III secretion protein T